MLPPLSMLSHETAWSAKYVLPASRLKPAKILIPDPAMSNVSNWR